MYTIILHTIKEEQYDDLELAIAAIQAECNATADQYCSNVTISFTPDDNSTVDDWYRLSVLPIDGNTDINHGNVKVKMITSTT